MNLRNTMPDIPDAWRGGPAAVCRILGGERPISTSTLKAQTRKLVSEGGIRPVIGANGRMSFTGAEVKRWWLVRMTGNPEMTVERFERGGRGRGRR